MKLARLAAFDVTHVGIGHPVASLAYFTRWRIFCRLITVLHEIALARQYLFQMSITLRFHTLARLAIACWSRHGYVNVPTLSAMRRFSGMLTTERPFVLPTKLISKCASIEDHRGWVVLLATESLYTNLSATAVPVLAALDQRQNIHPYQPRWRKVPYSTCAQVLVRTLDGPGKTITSSKQMALAHLILRYRGDLGSISTASMLLNSLKPMITA